MQEMDTDADVTYFNMSEEETEEERRQIRNEYRSMIEDVKVQSEDLVKSESAELKSGLESANSLFKKVTRTREATLDAQLLHMYASLGKQKAQDLHTGTVVYKPLEYAERLVTFLNRRPVDSPGTSCIIPNQSWIDAGKACSPLFKTAPAFHFMLGSFERGQVEIQARKANRPKENKDDNKKAVEPEKITKMDKSDQETTTEEVERILAILVKIYEQNDNKPIDYFEFVTDPNSFGRTVENMYHVSFLIKDNVAKIDLDDDELPVIEPILNKPNESEPSTSAQSQAEQSTGKNQCIIEIDMKSWEEIISAFKIKKAMIPPRRN